MTAVEEEIARLIAGGHDYDRVADKTRSAPDPAAVVAQLSRDRRRTVRVVAAQLAVDALPRDAAMQVLESMARSDQSADVRDVATDLLVSQFQAIPGGVAQQLRDRLTSNGPQPELLYAVWTLAKVRDADAAPLLRTLVSSYPWPPGKRAAEVAVTYIEEGEEAVVQRLLSHEHELRNELSLAVGLSGSRKAAAALRHWARSAPDDLCRAASEWALERAGAAAHDGLERG